MPKQKVSNGESEGKTPRRRKCSATTSSPANNRTVVRGAAVVERQLTQEMNQFGQVQIEFIKSN